METSVPALDSTDIDRSSDGVTASGAQSQPVTASNPNPEMGAEQQRVLTEVARLRTVAFSGGVRDEAVMHQIRDLSRYAFNVGPKPAFFEPAADGKAIDATPHDMSGTSLDLAREMAPMQEHEAANLVTRAKMQGLAPSIVSSIATLARAAALPAVVARVIFDRAVSHHGDKPDAPGTNTYRLVDTPQDLAEYHSVASEMYGSPEKFKQASKRVRRFLDTKKGPDGGSLLKTLEKQGLTRSTLAFDKRVLDSILLAAERDGVK